MSVLVIWAPESGLSVNRATKEYDMAKTSIVKACARCFVHKRRSHRSDLKGVTDKPIAPSPSHIVKKLLMIIFAYTAGKGYSTCHPLMGCERAQTQRVGKRLETG